jgi:hypothetical protein
MLLAVCCEGYAFEDKTSFQREIQPLLAVACFRCHGPDNQSREAGLRLDRRDEATMRLESNKHAIVPGQPDHSELVRRIRSHDPAEQMPPADAVRHLTDVEKNQLEKWITAGAPFDRHWSSEPIRRPDVPRPANAKWCRTPIDCFLLAKLNDARLPPAKQADATTLLRRMSYGLTGLPPSTEEVIELLALNDDDGVDTFFSDAIDRRLSSIQYGEHWARHWMDVVRYADSAGYERDLLFDHSWRYRDWLIRSLHANKSLDRFLQEQLAADQIDPDSDDARDALLFLVIGPRRFEGGIQRSAQREYEWLTDITDTTGSAFLGMTFGCARCHDHKFDAISQRDYFGLQSIFGDCSVEETRLGDAKDEKGPTSLRVVPRVPPAAFRLLHRGEIDQPQGESTPMLPISLSRGSASDPKESHQRRKVLAQWITAVDQPLTARVLVNRIWMWHFGKGLVRTPNDFGIQGDQPNYPELLDWLASELMTTGWNLNHLHRMILQSATYRMSSSANPDVHQHDPENRQLTRFSRRRLQAEELQDSLRFISGRLNSDPFGAPIVPPLEPWALAGLLNANWNPNPIESTARRRGLYMVVRRSMKLPFFESFNSPDTLSSCAARDTTTTPLQALTLLNSPEALVNARSFAARLWDESRGDVDAAVRLAWIQLFGHTVHDDERISARDFLSHAVPPNDGTAVPDAWVTWALILINSSEFSYVD